MDSNIIYSVLDHLDANSFNDLIYFLLQRDEYFASCKRLSHIDNRIIENPPERFFQTSEAFFVNYYPYSLYKNFCLRNLYLEELKELISKYIKERSYKLWLPVDGTRIFTIGNYDSRKLGMSDDELLLFYEKELSETLPLDFDIGLGNINTIINSQISNNGLDSLKQFINNNESGICINLSDDKILATRFFAEREFDGIIASPNAICQPIIKKVLDTDDKLCEFNQLINNDTKESVLEDFLYTYHDLFFGEKYDTLSTQVWLDFPEFDIGNKKRRLDIMMRNSISKDWEIFELKRSSVQLTKTKSDVPLFVSAVHDAIAQIRNYKRILNSDSVRRDFEAKGIEYYNPQFNLVIGQKPHISSKKWDWLLAQQSDINIITYDALLDSAKQRLNEMKNILAQV